jgi:hypothetical protein
VSSRANQIRGSEAGKQSRGSSPSALMCPFPASVLAR